MSNIKEKSVKIAKKADLENIRNICCTVYIKGIEGKNPTVEYLFKRLSYDNHSYYKSHGLSDAEILGAMQKGIDEAKLGRRVSKVKLNRFAMYIKLVSASFKVMGSQIKGSLVSIKNVIMKVK